MSSFFDADRFKLPADASPEQAEAVARRFGQAFAAQVESHMAQVDAYAAGTTRDLEGLRGVIVAQRSGGMSEAAVAAFGPSRDAAGSVEQARRRLLMMAAEMQRFAAVLNGLPTAAEEGPNV